MPQNNTEWLEQPNLFYHERQFEKAYRSTECFADWLDTTALLKPESSLEILDVASGMGAATYYLCERFPACNFLGLDLNRHLVEAGNAYFQKNARPNGKLETADLYDLPGSYAGRYNGVLMSQTLSWLSDYEEPLRKLAALDADFIAFTSLFYEGNITCRVQVHDYDLPGSKEPYKESFYNIYSLPRIRQLLHDCGYQRFIFKPFVMDIDLEKPSKPGMGTYTEKLNDGTRIQRSGPLLMPWYFAAASKV